MIRWIYSVQVSDSNATEATRWAKAEVEYARTRWPANNVQLFWQRFSAPTGAFLFMADCEDLNSLDRFLTELGPDEGWAKIMAEARPFWVEGSDQVLVVQSF